MSNDRISRELGRLHQETTDDFDKRTIAACQARNYGTRQGPDDKPKRGILPQSPKPANKA